MSTELNAMRIGVRMVRVRELDPAGVRSIRAEEVTEPPTPHRDACHSFLRADAITDYNIEVPTSSRIGQELARVRIGGDDGKQRVDATKHPQATGPTIGKVRNDAAEPAAKTRRIARTA